MHTWQDAKKWLGDAQDGNADSYRSFLKFCVPHLYSIVRHSVSDQNIVDDLVQDSLETINRAKHTYNPKHDLKPWIFAIVRSRISDYFRKHSRHLNNDTNFDLDSFSAGQTNAEQAAMSKAELVYTMRGLNKNEFELLWKAKVEEQSTKELAEHFNISESKVRVTLHRLIKKLRMVGT